ncbi:MAG TPA: hypothetical protein VK177_19250 [Flavobacteriales bacterium]|nr:hypothetical protein [Flavobacteriales bacterium]
MSNYKSTLSEKIAKIVFQVSRMHINDPNIPQCWDAITQLLIRDESETIDFLNSCDDEYTLGVVSASFADASFHLQSNHFIRCLEKLEQKFPGQHLKYMVADAKNAMDNE